MSTGNPTPLIAVAAAVIAVCVVLLFVLSGGEPASPQPTAGDCVPADGRGTLPCGDAEAVYRVLDTRDAVTEAAAPAACSEVPGVVAVGWEGAEGGPGTAFCFGPR